MAQDPEPTETLVEAVPEALTHQGRLVDDEGQPMTGDVELTYTIWDHPTEGAVLWQDAVEVELDDTGFYSVQLGGEDNPIDAAVLADGQGWMGVAVNGDDEMDPRITLNSVPYAVAADEAVRADRSRIADEAQLAHAVQEGAIGTEALEDGFELDPEHVEQATGETLEGLSCANGDIARFDGSNWNCDDQVQRAATAEVADVAETVEDGSIGSDSLASDFSVSPSQVDGDTLGGLSCANGDVARFDGNDWSCDDFLTGAVTDVGAAAPLESTGGTEPVVSLPQADEDTDGYLAADDFASFDQRVENLEEGDAISIDGEATSPEISVEFGEQAGTAVEGDDERLTGPREPLPGSDNYVQIDPDAPQDGSLEIDGDAHVGDLNIRGDTTTQDDVYIRHGIPTSHDSSEKHYILLAPTGETGVRLSGTFFGARGGFDFDGSSSSNHPSTGQVDVAFALGDAQEAAGAIAATATARSSGIHFKFVTVEYDGTEYHAIEHEPVSNHSYWQDSVYFEGYLQNRDAFELRYIPATDGFLGDVTDSSIDHPSEIFMDADTLTVDGEIISRVSNGVVYAGYPDFSSLQDAIDWAEDNGYITVSVPPGEYDPITVPEGMHISGGEGSTSCCPREVHITGAEDFDGDEAVVELAGRGSSLEGVTIGDDADYGVIIRNQGEVQGARFDGADVACVLMDTDGSRHRVLGNNFSGGCNANTTGGDSRATATGNTASSCTFNHTGAAAGNGGC